MMEIGRLCVKIAGRDSNKKCVIVDILDKNYVLIDGETRRKKCNIKHLEPLAKLLEIKKGSSHEQVVEEFVKLGIEIKEPVAKEKKEKPVKIRKIKIAKENEDKTEPVDVAEPIEEAKKEEKIKKKGTKEK